MNDEMRTLRTRGPDSLATLDRLYPPGVPGVAKFLGKVIDGGSFPTGSNKYCLANPVDVGGTEAEGSAVSLDADTGTRIPGIVLGLAPVVGDYLVFASIGGRWVAYKRGSSGTVTTPIATIPSCFCTAIPQTLTMVSSDHSADFSTFQDDTIQWGPRPSWAAPLSATVSDPGFFGTATWPDPTAGGAGFIYYLGCTGNTITLTRLYETSPFGSPFRDGTLYTWLIGSPNTCNPDGSNFRMDTGTPYAGSDPVTVTVDGP